MKERRQSPSEEDLVEKIATNPIHAYKMMKRFTVDWKSLQVSKSKKHIFFVRFGHKTSWAFCGNHHFFPIHIMSLSDLPKL